ncbi:MAG: AI-2E family transporter [Acidobacteriota bacterium]|nr:AI-2E family transporter [Acidobacteriota bacterium]
MNVERNNSFSNQNKLTRREFAERVLIFFGILSAVVLLWLLFWQGIGVILLVFAGLLFAVLFRSLASLLARYTPVPENWSLYVVLLFLAALSILSVWLILPSIQQQLYDFSEQLPKSWETARQQIANLPYGNQILSQVPQQPLDLFGNQSSNVFGRITGFFSSFLGALVNVLIVLLIGIYFAFNPKLYMGGIVKLFPANHQERARIILETLGFTLRNWIIGRTVVGILIGSATTVGLWFLGIPFAIPLGILAGLLNAVPNIGPIIAGIPAVLLALPEGFSMVGYVILLYLVLQSLEGYILTPLVQQRTISLPPVLVLSGQLLFGILFGFLGILLAVPAVAVIFTLIRMLYVEDVLGNEVEVKGERQAKQATQEQSA